MITPSFASAPPTFQINFSFSLICACLFERSLHPSWLGGKKKQEKFKRRNCSGKLQQILAAIVCPPTQDIRNEAKRGTHYAYAQLA